MVLKLKFYIGEFLGIILQPLASFFHSGESLTLNLKTLIPPSMGYLLRSAFKIMVLAWWVEIEEY